MVLSSNSHLTKHLPSKSNFLIIIAIFISLILASFATLASENSVSVGASVLNVRTGPGLTHDVAYQVHENDELYIIDEENDWLKVRLPNDEVGWVASWLVNSVEVTSQNQSFGRVTGSQVNIREYATVDSQILGTVNQGAELQMLYQENGWVQVLFNDQVAWIHGDYITPMESGSASHSSETSGSSESNKLVQVGDQDINIRANASTDSANLGLAPAGSTFTYLGSVGDWYQIQLNDGQTAYIAGWYASLIDNQANLNEQAPQETTNIVPAIAESTIVIDAGHGGTDPGAVNGDTYEKSIALSTAYNLQRKLQNAGANVIMTRSDDRYIPLEDRVAIAEQTYADAFISLHYDANDKPNSASGTSSYFYSSQDSELAESINYSLASYGPLQNNGVKQADFFVLRTNSRPSVLLELGFMNSDHDLNHIQTAHYQETIADAIFIGLQDYFN